MPLLYVVAAVVSLGLLVYLVLLIYVVLELLEAGVTGQGREP